MSTQKWVLVLVTHDGPFHADDVLAVAWMIHTHPFARIDIVRTRDEAKLQAALNDGMSILIDVGGKCKPSMGWLDHHMPEGRPTWEDGAPMAAAGLCLHYTCKEYGISVDELPDEIVALFKHVDAVDNALSAPTNFQFSRLVGECNPSRVNITASDFNKSFMRVVKITQLMLSGMFRGEFMDIDDAQRFFEIQAEPLLKRHKQDLQESETRLKSFMGLWKGSSTLMLDNFEPSAKLLLVGMPGLKLYAFPAVGNNNEYMVQVAPKTTFKFPTAWWGLYEKDLKVAGAPEGVQYCHHAGFLCKVANKEVAQQLLNKFK